MVKRLLTLLLVAFVLCTMAINAFALSNDDGLPLMLDYSGGYKAFGQYNYNSAADYTSRMYISGECPWCGENVTYVNWYWYFEDLKEDFDFDNSYVLLGSYFINNEDNFTNKSFFIGLNQFMTVCPNASEESAPAYWRDRYVFTWYEGFAGTRNKPSNMMIHRGDISTDLLNGGWYAAFYDRSNFISTQVCDVSDLLFNQLTSTNAVERYYNRTKDWILKSFLSSPYQGQMLNLTFDMYLNYGYEQGYIAGSVDAPKIETEKVFKEGFDKGVLHGQDMSDWNFFDLFDGLFAGFSEFIAPFTAIGINDITVGSLISLVGVVYVTLLLLKIVRG